MNKSPMANFDGTLFEVDPHHDKNRRIMDLIEKIGDEVGFNKLAMLGNVDEILERALEALKAAKLSALRDRPTSGPTEADLAGDPRPLYGLPPLDQSMKFSLYLAKLVAFVVDNNVPRDLPSRVRKAGEEMGEVGEAVALYLETASITGNARGYLAGVREEAADLVNVGIDILAITGGLGEIVPTLIDNLDRKAEKYREGRNREGARA